MAERRKAKRKAPATSAKKSRPDGSISATIFETVEKLVKGGLSRAAAFRQIAKETGRKEGTVAVNYYYAAKKRGTKLRKRGPARKVSAGKSAGGPTRVLALLASLGQLIRAQAAELESLRSANQRFAEIRRLIGQR
jgi:hypothetical protein